MENLNEPTPPIVKSSHSHILIQKDGSLSPGGLMMAETSADSADMRPSTSPPTFATFYSGSNSRQRSNGQKCSRRKRDLVLSVSSEVVRPDLCAVLASGYCASVLALYSEK